MESLSILIAVLILCVVIIVHELGHFIFAKLNGIVVEEFSVGMGPRILSTERNGTIYSLKLIPFGGACMMKGEDDGDSSEGSFNSKSAWRRISVVAAGPVFNFILAFVGAIVIIGTIGYDAPEVIKVTKDSPEALAGMQEGDLITKFDGKSVNFGRELYSYINLEGLKDKDIVVEVLRDGEKAAFTYHPATQDRYMLGFSYSATEEQPQLLSVTLGGALQKAGLEAGDYIYGINGQRVETGLELAAYFEENPLTGDELTLTYLRDGLEYDIHVTPEEVHYVEQNFTFNLEREKTNPLGVLKYSVLEVRYWINSVLQGFKLLVTGRVGVESLSGPVGVVEVIGDTYEESKSAGPLYTWLSMLNMLILITANLGVMNLLPLPALDGGRLIFLIIEAIRRKPINREAEGMIHFAGLLLLMVLMVFVTFMDIGRIF